MWTRLAVGGCSGQENMAVDQNWTIFAQAPLCVLRHTVSPTRPLPQYPVLSASNVVGRTRAEVCNNSVMFWSREQPI